MEIIKTADGSLSARHPLLGDLYHSDRGAVGESLYVYVEKGLFYCLENKRSLRIFDMGFGTGLNAWTTFSNLPQDVLVEYVTVEKYPLSFSDQYMMDYSDCDEYKKILSALWNVKTEITSNFSLLKIQGDVLDFDFNSVAPLDLVYWDAFAPESQPELWSGELFSRLAGSMPAGGVVVTYSSKGEVKRALRDAGFDVQRLPGALGKRHMLRAVKQ